MKTKCLVAATVWRARLWAKELDLDQNEWYLIGWNGPLLGYCFDRIIIVEPPTDGKILGIHRDWHDCNLRLKIRPDGYIRALY